MRVEEAMANLTDERQQAHAYLDQLPPAQLTVVHRLLESMLDPVSRALTNASIEDEEISEEERQVVERSKEWFKHNESTPFEGIVAEAMASLVPHTASQGAQPQVGTAPSSVKILDPNWAKPLTRRQMKRLIETGSY